MHLFYTKLRSQWRFSIPLVCLTLGIALATALWPRLSLPYTNPYNAVGLLALSKYNPLNNILRFLIFAFSPALLFSVLYLLWPNSQLKLSNYTLIEPNKSAPRSLWLAAILWVGISLIVFLSQDFQPKSVDLFHEGEYLASALRSKDLGGIWTSSFFVHGALHDPLFTLLSWQLFGQTTIGSMQFLNALLDWLAVPALAFFIAALSQGRIAIFLFLAAVTILATNVSGDAVGLFQIGRRDILVFLGLAILLRRTTWTPALVGLLMPLNFLISIERGLFFSTSVIIILGLPLILTKTKEHARPLILLISSALIATFLLTLYFGKTEIIAFFDSVRINLSTRGLVDGLEYDAPFVHKRSTLIPTLIAIQVMSLVFLLFNRINQKNSIFFQIHWTLTAAAIVFFGYALSRADVYHLTNSSVFPILGIGWIFLWLLFEKIPRTTTTLSSLLFLFAITQLHPVESLSKASGATKRISQFIEAPDEAFLNPNQKQVLEKFAQLSANDSCVFLYPSEAAWSFLLRKKTCSKVVLTHVAGSDWHRTEVLESLRINRPNVVMYASPLHWSNMDGISNAQRFPDIERELRDHYALFVNIDGYELWTRK